MGLVQQEWVGQSRGKMPLPRFYWQPWERHLAAIHLLIAAGRRSHGRRSHGRRSHGRRSHASLRFK